GVAGLREFESAVLIRLAALARLRDYRQAGAAEADAGAVQLGPAAFVRMQHARAISREAQRWIKRRLVTEVGFHVVGHPADSNVAADGVVVWREIFGPQRETLKVARGEAIHAGSPRVP